MQELESAKIQTESLVLEDIPLILGMVAKLGLVEVVNTHVTENGNHQGLSTGWLVGIWLAHILHTGNHAKSTVRDWANRHKILLERLIDEEIREVDFEDNRLSRVLSRLSESSAWLKIEKGLWSKVVNIYELPSIAELLERQRCVMAKQSPLLSDGIMESSAIPDLPYGEDALSEEIDILGNKQVLKLPICSPIPGVHIDLTGSSGYHLNSAGYMQYGKNKDHRPDLRQFKLVGASFDGHLLSTQVLAGNEADNPHYLPMAARVRTIVGKQGLLYAGDSKMADLQTRARLHDEKDYYLTRLPATKGNAVFIKDCISDGMERALELIYRDGELLGGGYELSRNQIAVIELENGEQKEVEWVERVVVVRSLNYAQGQTRKLNRNIGKAITAIEKLTPQPARGKRQIREQKQLDEQINTICKTHRITADLLKIDVEKEVTIQEKYVNRGRAKQGEDRPKKQIETVRFQINEVTIDQQALQQASFGLGWIVYVTQVPKLIMNLAQTVSTYRENNSLENQFRRFKNDPINIRPIWVTKDNQIEGLTNLLSIALRLSTFAETIMQQALQQEEKPEDRQIAGLYPELPTKKTDRPTFKRCCNLFSNAKITTVNIYFNAKLIKSELHRFEPNHWKILNLLNIPVTIYTELRI